MARKKGTGISDPTIVWRKYFGHSINIGLGTLNIHDKLFGNSSQNLSPYGNEDAMLLTDFFRKYKKAAAAQDKTLGDLMFLELGQTTIKLPILDFTLGGNASNTETAGGRSSF